MAITTYTELQATIADYLARGDLTAQIPTLVTLAESRMNRTLRARDMETSATVAMTAGSGPLPTGYLEWLSATWNGTRTADLRYVEPDSEDWRFRYRVGGDPSMFTIVGSTLTLRPVQTGNVTLVYYSTLPPLATNSTNWLLARAPDLYLNLSLAEAYILDKDEQRAQLFMQLAYDSLDKTTIDADSNKLTRRPAKQAETADIAASRNPQTSGL